MTMQYTSGHPCKAKLGAMPLAWTPSLKRSWRRASTTLDGTFVLQACIINPRTQPEGLECLVALVRDLGTQLAKGGV